MGLPLLRAENASNKKCVSTHRSVLQYHVSCHENVRRFASLPISRLLCTSIPVTMEKSYDQVRSRCPGACKRRDIMAVAWQNQTRGSLQRFVWDTKRRRTRERYGHSDQWPFRSVKQDHSKPADGPCFGSIGQRPVERRQRQPDGLLVNSKSEH